VDPREEFLRHAADCEAMAESARDPASRLSWKQMAEKWRECASSTPARAMLASALMNADRVAREKFGREKMRESIRQGPLDL
jgi:hypothetical protein